jgi:hypothetical protein
LAGFLRSEKSAMKKAVPGGGWHRLGSARLISPRRAGRRSALQGQYHVPDVPGLGGGVANADLSEHETLAIRPKPLSIVALHFCRASMIAR